MEKIKILKEAYTVEDINKRFPNFKWTPMMTEWKKIRDYYINLYGENTIVLYQVGTFYETYFYDAYVFSKLLNLSYTTKSSKDEYSANLCGCPIYVWLQKANTLLEHGFNVIMVSESWVSGSENFKREVTHILTPWTNLYTPNSKENYYILSLHKNLNRIWISFLDITINDFKFIELDLKEELKIKNTIISFFPREVIWNKEAKEDKFLSKILKELFLPEILVYDCKNNYEELLTNQFKQDLTTIFSIEDSNSIVSSANVLSYIKETQQSELEFVNKISKINLEESILLDEITIKNLEIYKNNNWNSANSLVTVLDETVTPFWARMFRKLIIKPFKNLNKIKERLNTVEELVLNFNQCNKLIEDLSKLGDIERIASRIGTSKCTPVDLIQLKESLKIIPNVKNNLEFANTWFLKQIKNNLNNLEDVISLIENTLLEDVSINAKEGKLIKKTVNERLDELITLTEEKELWMKNQEDKLIKETGIEGLKITENNLGIYIEIKRVKKKWNDSSNEWGETTEHTAESYDIPKDWEMARGLKSADRYVNEDLKKFFIKSLTATTERYQLEFDLFNQLRIDVAKYINEIQKNSKFLAHLDVFTNFAKLAKYYNFVKPIVNNTNNIIIKKGRHPVIERLTTFIDNDTFLNENSFHLITGVNSWWKSTFIRQNALIVLLAQIGSFVPAESAEIGIVDWIFTRVGSTDNLSKKQSTFINEMVEISYILNNATCKSLVILDEVWSSTSFQDWLSLAQSISEYFIDLKTRVLFATHYHELVDVINNYDNAKNYFVDFEIKNWKFNISHKIISWASQRSYWVEVAELLWLKKEIIKKAKEIRLNKFNY